MGNAARKPSASVSLTLGVTDITIKYSRPPLNGKTLAQWLDRNQALYGQVWREGANEATTISFSTEVKIEGQPLAAGTYALFMIPSAGDWTVVFNKVAQWGAFTYKQDQDALRVKSRRGRESTLSGCSTAFPWLQQVQLKSCCNGKS